MFGSWFPGKDNKIKENTFLSSERKQCSFSIPNLTKIIDGSEKQTNRRRWIWEQGEMFNNANNYFLSREDLISQHIERFIKLHKEYTESFIPTANDVMIMSVATKNGGAMSLHYGAFLPTIASQGTDEQRMEWLFPAFKMEIIGCLAQTELGHGSNVRALQTTATYSIESNEFILHSPTLESIKMWPGGLGKTATHAIVYAQLIIKDKNYGIHSFILQLRDENHKPLNGIELGEVGPKIGDNFTETGFMRLNHVKIPRNWMLMKNQIVTPNGEYQKLSKGKSGDKIQYTTMLSIRTALVIGAGYKLAQGVTISTRYSFIRHQGFIDPDNSKNTHMSPEKPIISYQNQLYRITKQLSIAYAFVFTGKYINEKFTEIRKQIDATPETADLSALPEMHASSSGLKALCTFTTADGLEECRKLCGGHGVLLVSGVAQLAVDYVTYCTAEGDRIILELQCARYLMKAYEQAISKLPLSGACNYLQPLSNSKEYEMPQIDNIEMFQNMDILLELFKLRAFNQVSNTGNRLSVLLKTYSPSEARNNCAIELVKSSRCHCYFIILQSFIEQVKIIKNNSIKNVLENLCLLFGLIHIQENAGDWIGYLTINHINWIKESINYLLQELQHELIGLTDAFEFPDNVLNSALGRYDGNVYESIYNSAKSSPLNDKDPFKGYQFLSEILNKEFIAENAKKVSSKL